MMQAGREPTSHGFGVRLPHLWVLLNNMETIHFEINKSSLLKKIDGLAGFEPAARESKSRMLTIYTTDQNVASQGIEPRSSGS